MNKETYTRYVTAHAPHSPTGKNCLFTFFVGGGICTLAQGLREVYEKLCRLSQEDAASWTSLILVLGSVVLTGFNLYSRLAQWGGAGALVPITGFANSVAAPAIEYQKDGQVFGIGCKIFTIAGPVILYGIFTSWALGVIYWITTMF